MNDFTVLVLPGAYASSVTLTLDVLAAAAAMAVHVGVAPPRWRVYGTQAGDIHLPHGLTLRSRPLPLRARPDRSVWVVPGLGVERPEAALSRLAEPDAQRAIRALRAQVRGGGMVGASCSAVYLLQAADLLAGRKATISWWLAPQLQRLEPRCQVQADRVVVADGLVVTAGAALAHSDLMLHLLRDRCGAALADAVSRVLLLDARQTQAPFVMPSLLGGGHELVATLVARIERSLPKTPSVAQLAAECGVSERTLSRHVRAATGRSPLALVQSVRLSKARLLLEGSMLSVEQVAERVGYADAGALRRLMRKLVGATPRQIRPAANGLSKRS
ncbi:GlxA family transcriptional regulator [Caldimonas brevitalea]|uniref:AraC family transcriptional regulator n=1 Tax=Caldimonas brevitalea TaxID=413882 RepID=A0A0G3BQG2_9BURK|nr:helix-turn-helix domain-containing protein [Caldimonas brevitalea]AKJ30228.1 AraC family transcriptional regulator [Caldimonas brevitalea]